MGSRRDRRAYQGAEVFKNELEEGITRRGERWRKGLRVQQQSARDAFRKETLSVILTRRGLSRGGACFPGVNGELGHATRLGRGRRAGRGAG
jgi:hypothetical protein